MESTATRLLGPPLYSIINVSRAESKVPIPGRLSWTQTVAGCNSSYGLISKPPTSCKRRLDVSAAAVDAPSSESAAPAMKPRVEDIVIVGGGIAGLATALALRRLGVKSVVLEQSEDLRVAGSAIGIWSNAWRALEALGVANGLRNEFIKLSGYEFFGSDGSLILNLGLDGASRDRDIELRAVDRKALIEAVRKPLPDGQVLYGYQVIGIKKLKGDYTEVRCKDGQTMQTKVLIGCDGIRSVVAKWMNIEQPRYAGYTATRGLAEYPDGHKLTNKAKQILGRGVRAGLAPMDANRVYWSVVFNSSGERLTDLELVRKEALDYVRGWPSMITEAINRSPLETLSRRGVADRWMWPVGGPPLYKGGVTLAGDAMHPMTPNLGQGGCCALEDAVILARALSKALVTTDPSASGRSHMYQAQEMEQIELAFKSYTEERRRRIFPLVIRSNVTGAILQLDSEIICSVRNELLSRIVKVDRFFDHTCYDCGTLC